MSLPLLLGRVKAVRRKDVFILCTHLRASERSPQMTCQCFIAKAIHKCHLLFWRTDTSYACQKCILSNSLSLSLSLSSLPQTHFLHPRVQNCKKQLCPSYFSHRLLSFGGSETFTPIFSGIKLSH